MGEGRGRGGGRCAGERTLDPHNVSNAVAAQPSQVRHHELVISPDLELVRKQRARLRGRAARCAARRGGGARGGGGAHGGGGLVERVPRGVVRHKLEEPDQKTRGRWRWWWR